MTEFPRFTCHLCGERKNKHANVADYFERYPYDRRRLVCESCFEHSFIDRCEVCDGRILKSERYYAIFTEVVPAGYGTRVMTPGYYRVLDYPIVSGPIFGSGGHIVDDHLALMGPLKGHEKCGNGHVCADCVANAGIATVGLSLAKFNHDGTMRQPAKTTTAAIPSEAP